MTLPKPILLATLATFGLAAQTAVLMNPYDAFTTGATTRETTLTAANVGGARFGKLYTYCVDGAVYAQPLYVPGLRNVLCIATMTDKVYVFDADKPGPPLWLRDLTNELAGGRDLAGPAYWDGDGGPAIYLWTEADVLKAFRFDGSRLDPTPFAKGDVPSKGSPGGALTISSDGKRRAPESSGPC